MPTIDTQVVVALAINSVGNTLNGRLESELVKWFDGENGSAVQGFRALGAQSFGSYVEVNFNTDLALGTEALAPQSWVIYGAPGEVVSVGHVSLKDPDTIRLQVGEQVRGRTYTIHMPQAGILDVDGYRLDGSKQIVFLGSGNGPILVSVRSTGSHRIEAIYNKPVNEQDAVKLANYAISGGLTVRSVTKISDTTYEVGTSRQSAGVTYTVVVTNVRDLTGNIIDSD